MTDGGASHSRDLADFVTALFVNDSHELRSGWRVAVFILAVIVVASVVEGAAHTIAILVPSLGLLAVNGPPQAPTADRFLLLGALISQIKLVSSVLVASAFSARWLERRPLASVGFKPHSGWLRDFALGTLIGLVTIVAAVGIEVATGSLHFNRQSLDATAAVSGFGYLFVFFLLAGTTEELLFRGFAFQALIQGTNGFLAMSITAVVFGFAHVANANASVFSTINTVMAGIWLGVAYLMTRSLWLATALHYSWNFGMTFVFGLPVSGIISFQKLTLLQGQSSSPWWISGGDYGPEAGAGATVALLLSTLLLWKSGWFRPAPEMLEALRHGKPEPPLTISPSAGNAEAGNRPGLDQTG